MPLSTSRWAPRSDNSTIIQLHIMKKLVIFDLDGTLLNTITDLGMAANYALKKNGFAEGNGKANENNYWRILKDCI